MSTLILAIESSCDDTAFAVINEAYEICYEKTASHIEILQYFGGVVPESVSREHLQALWPMLEDLKKHINLKDLTGIAFTQGPGLAGSLLVGSSLAHSLSVLLRIPLLPVHHIVGHFCAYLLETKKPLDHDALALIVSGGHTQILKVSPQLTVEILGQSRDDAVGEVFDKVAKHLGLGYPGGPMISKLAEQGAPTYALTMPMVHKKTLDMSFSGLKSQTIRAWTEHPSKKEDLCKSFEETITETLLKKVSLALESHEVKTGVLAGGVAANKVLREKLQTLFQEKKKTLIIPASRWCTDNAAMIAAAALYHYHDLKKPHGGKIDFIKSQWSIEDL